MFTCVASIITYFTYLSACFASVITYIALILFCRHQGLLLLCHCSQYSSDISTITYTLAWFDVKNTCILPQLAVITYSDR